MSNVFLKFHERAVRSGIANDRPDFGRELNSTLEQFTTLARNATKVTEGSDVEDRGDDEIAPSSSPKKAKTSSLPPVQEPGPLIPETRTDPQFANMPLGYQMQPDSGSGGSSSERTSEEPASGEYLPTVPMRDANLLLQRFADPTSSNYLPWMNELAPINGGSGAQLQQYDALFPMQPPIADSLDQAFPFDASAPLTLLDGPLFDFAAPEPEAIGSLSPTGLNAIPSVSAKLGLPYTFSFQETTFSRRLNRAAVERAFHLISQADLRPQRYNQVFRLSLMYSTRDEVRGRLKDVLNRTATESLDNCGGPFQHLGGAGTHYPRTDAQGNVIARPDCFTERRIGPIRTIVEKENQALGLDLASAFAQSSTDSWAVLEGYEGEWFDADDVSGYLEERGVKIPAQASFVEGEVEEIQDPKSSVREEEPEVTAPIDFSEIFAPSAATLASMAAGNKGSTESDSFAVHNIFHNISTVEKQSNNNNDYFNLNSQDDLAPSLKPDDFAASAWFDDSMTSGEQPSPGLTTGTTITSTDAAAHDSMDWDKPRRRKQTVTVEVSKLIDELIRRAVCIGRSPGFRRKDVDDALRASVISVF